MKRIFALFLAVVLLMASAAALGESNLMPGEYSAQAQGFGGAVTVTVTVGENGMDGITALGENETPSIGGAALELLSQRAMEAGSSEIDGVSGATLTSNGFKDALSAALAKASGLDASESKQVLDGTYEQTVYGNNFDVPFKVAVTFEGGKIQAIEVTDIGGEWSSYDTTMLDAAVETIIPRIIENQSIAVDTTAGATASSSAIRHAVRLAIEEAGGDPAAFSIPVEKSNETVRLDYDVVVVGLGASGVAAYYSAAENGATVLGIEKAGYVGGNSITTGGPLCVNPSLPELKAYDDAGNEIVTDEEAFIELWKNDTGAGTENGSKPDMIELIVRQSGDAVDWSVSEMGFTFTPITTFMYPDLTVYACYDCLVKTPNRMYTDALERAKGFNEKNDYLLEVEGTGLIAAGDGSIIGVTAEAYDGTRYEINARSVILCTGGFAGSSDMMEEYVGYTMAIYGMYQNDGVMIKSAIDHGAATYSIGIDPITHNARTAVDLHMSDVSPAHQKTLTALVLRGDVLAVNESGARFTSETDMMGLGETNTRADGSYYVIVDENYFENLKQNGFDAVDFMINNRDFSSPFSAYLSDTTRLTAPPQYYLAENDPITEMDAIIAHGMDAGIVFEGATPEELAARIGAPALVEAIADYNKAIEAGVDEEFGKDISQMHPIGVNGEKIYAVKAKGFCFTTSGGLDVNTNIEVLDVNGEVIPGLYACGTDSLGVFFSEESGYKDYGGVAHGWCFVSGKIAGENAAAHAKAE